MYDIKAKVMNSNRLNNLLIMSDFQCLMMNVMTYASTNQKRKEKKDEHETCEGDLNN